MKQDKDCIELREKLAELEHNQWMMWSKNIVKIEVISFDRIKRWEGMWKPYSELTDDEKDQHREWADKILDIINEQNLITQNRNRIINQIHPLKMLNIDTKANNGCFGLEYWLRGIVEKKLLSDGVEFCKLLEIGAEQLTATEVNGGDFNEDAYDTVQILAKYLKDDELKDVVNESAMVRQNMGSIIDKQQKFSDAEIRKMQHFFNTASAPLLRETSRMSHYRSTRW